MGGLKKYMPITYWTSADRIARADRLPGTSGFFSKDALIEAVHASHNPGATYAYWCVFLGVFITRVLQLPPRVHDLPRSGAFPRGVAITRHGADRHARDERMRMPGTSRILERLMTLVTACARPRRSCSCRRSRTSHDDHGHHGPVEPHESPWSMTLPLILLAIPSLFIGAFTDRRRCCSAISSTAMLFVERGATTCSATSARSGTVHSRFIAARGDASRRCVPDVRRAGRRPGSCTSSVRTCRRVIADKFSALYKLFAQEVLFRRDQSGRVLAAAVSVSARRCGAWAMSS